MTTAPLRRTRVQPSPVGRAALPPAGPAWFPVVMGTGILASLLATTGTAGAAGTLASRVLLVLGWAVAGGLTAAWVTACRRHPGTARASLVDPGQVPAWGTVSMGVLSLGAATLAVLPAVAPALLTFAVAVDVTTWVTGTLLGLATTVRFATLLLVRSSRHRLGRPTPVWGLPVVAPMVSATVGAALVPHLPVRVAAAVLLVSLGCFVVALVLGAAVFALSYLHHARVEPLPVAQAFATWIPLGIVGQSTAAVQTIAAAVPDLRAAAAVPDLRAAAAVLDLRAAAAAYGLVMLLLAVPVVTHAARATASGLRAGITFAPGWWALTFPLGTLALGAHLLGEATGWAAASVLSGACLLGLVGTWTLCVVATVRAVARPTWGPSSGRLALRGTQQGPRVS